MPAEEGQMPLRPLGIGPLQTNTHRGTKDRKRIKPRTLAVTDLGNRKRRKLVQK